MCGIVGIVDLKGQETPDRSVLVAMNEVQSHRGPDEVGLFLEPGIGFGHKRLSIIDLASGQQPFFSADGNVVLSYNGEIYNFMEVRAELEAKGHAFRTNCDTEVIVYAWVEWGPECVHKLRGMFAFSIWDKATETLFLARDRLGIKPLYYTVLADGRLLFASELKGILQHPDLPRRLDLEAVEDYFAYGYVPDPKSIFKNVHKLLPGHTLLARRGGEPKVTQYWDLTFQEAGPDSEEALAEALIPELREAVRLRMIADVPLGAFLSGGVDSSAVVAMMAGLSEEPVNTCSIGFDRQDHDESHFAREVAGRYETNHNVRIVDPQDFDLVEKLASIYDEPFADSSAIPTYRVCELARQRVTVALSGDGGDELFAGYRRYRWHAYEQRVRSRMAQSIRGPLFGFLGRTYPKLDWAPQPLRAKTTFQALALDAVDGFFHSVSMLPDTLRRSLFSDSMHRELAGYQAVEVLRGYMANAPADDALSRVQYADFKTYLPGDILTKVDRASMAHSLEVRVPILDHEFIGWAARIPSQLRLKGREGKYIFKKALEPYLPESVLYREKMGFAVPISAWFRGPLRGRISRLADSELLGDSGLFDMAFLQKLVSQHTSGLRENSGVLWALLMFESSVGRVLGAVSSDEAAKADLRIRAAGR